MSHNQSSRLFENVNMTSDQLRNVILEAVDCLRQRKCRPDRESIAVYVMRKLGSSMNEIFSEIENIVDQGSLLKVEYKGSTSYRSPKNFDIKNSPLLTKHSKILNSSKTTRYVISAMNELLSSFPKYVEDGIPYEELKNKLMEVDKERFAESGLRVIFEREEGAGNILVAQSDDPIYPLRIFPKDIKVPADMALTTFTETASAPPERKRKKRPKKEDGDYEHDSSAANSPASKSSPVNNSKAKEDLVYAVKSVPNKLPESDSSEGDKLVKVKAEQISSIGLKVVAGKGIGSRKAVNEKSKAKGKVVLNISEDSSNQKSDRKPCLTLLSHDTVVDKHTTKTGRLHDNGANAEGSCTKKPVKRKKVSGGLPNEVTNPLPAGVKGKKKMTSVDSSLNVEGDADDHLVVNPNPPRFTYASKRRRNYNNIDSNNDEMGICEDSSLDISTSSNGQYVDECAYCHKKTNCKGDSENILCCGSCNAKIHPTCIDYSEDQAKRLRMNSSRNGSHFQWQCFSCKRCGVCQKALMSSKNGSEMMEAKGKPTRKKGQRYILCDQCDRGYHVECINSTPPSSESSWYCRDCSPLCRSNENATTDLNLTTKNPIEIAGKIKAAGARKKGRQSSSPNNAGCSTPISEVDNKIKFISAEDADSKTVGCTNDASEVPDISSWTPSQVQKYFIEKGLQDEAASLREQEVDGMSLLLLRRADVIFGLNLRLGPALKIYRLVCQLQQNSSALKKRNSKEYVTKHT